MFENNQVHDNLTQEQKTYSNIFIRQHHKLVLNLLTTFHFKISIWHICLVLSLTVYLFTLSTYTVI